MNKQPFLSTFVYAAKGLKLAFRERNFKLHIISALVVTVLGFYCKITKGEWVAVLLCIALVTSLEIVNTAIEEVVNLVSPEYNEKAGRIKDLAAAAVLFASIIALITGLIIFLPHLY